MTGIPVYHWNIRRFQEFEADFKQQTNEVSMNSAGRDDGRGREPVRGSWKSGGHSARIPALKTNKNRQRPSLFFAPTAPRDSPCSSCIKTRIEICKCRNAPKPSNYSALPQPLRLEDCNSRDSEPQDRVGRRTSPILHDHIGCPDTCAAVGPRALASRQNHGRRRD